MTKAPEVNPVTAKVKAESASEDRHNTSSEIYEWSSQKEDKKTQGR